MQSIMAECHSDDYLFQVKFNALAWFEQATRESLIDLHNCEYGGDYAADDVATGMRDSIKELDTLLDYVTKQRDMGFECHVDEDAARAWIKENRPEIAAEIFSK